MSYQEDKLTEIADAIRAKRGTTNSIKASDFASEIASISTGQSAPEWEPNPTWWDIEAILNADTEDIGNGGKAIFLITNSYDAVTLDFEQYFSKIKTSDGQVYTSNISHNWNTSMDKECNMSYKTRYIIGYTSNTSKDFGAFARLNLHDACLYSYFYKCNFSNCSFGAVSGNKCNTIQSIKFNNVKGNITSLYNSFYNCNSLQHISLPYDWDINSIRNAFYNCCALKYINLPETWVNMTNIISVFELCVSLCSVNLPTSWVKVTSMYGMFYNCYSMRLINIPDTWINIDNMQGAFNSCYNIVSINLPTSLVKVNNITNIFNNCYNIMSINLPSSWINIVNMSNSFKSCISLTSIENNRNEFIDVSFSINESPLNRHSILNLLYNLKDSTSTTTKTLGLGTALLNKITTEEKLIATSKNWTLA